MKRLILIGSILLVPGALLAQAPAAAPAPAKIAIIDFQRAIVENSEGKIAQGKLMGEVNRRQSDIEKKQKAVEDMQNKLRTGATALSDQAKADLTRQIDQATTDLNRMSEDAQKEMGELQQGLFRPIAEKTGLVLQAYAKEAGLTLVFDVSSQASSIMYAGDGIDITEEVIKRVDAELSKSARPAPAPAAAAPPKPAEPPKKP